jgi:predicted RNase H-like HicB family nuclease
MLKIEFDREEDGRWIAEVPALPGVMAYGHSKDDARDKVAVLALRVIADRLEHGEPIPEEASELFAAA